MTKNQLEIKIMELENKKAEMEDQACYILADILEKRVNDLKMQLEG
jgi:hypothetical protein